MSHFSVLVIGPDVDKQLAPYHEYECTGRDDEFVQDVDETDELRSSYESDTTARYRDPDGGLHDPYRNQFYRDPTPDEASKIGRLGGTGFAQGISFTSKDWGDGRGYCTKVHFLPDGWAEVRLPHRDVQTFREYVEKYHGITVLPYGARPDDDHKYHYAQLNEAGEIAKVIRRTNPNKKWDWYQIGGRWTGSLKLKAKAHGTVGRPGLMTERAAPGYADQALKRDVDLEQMREDEAIKARNLWTTVREITGGQAWESWDDTRLRYPNIEDARREYHEQPAIVLLKASKIGKSMWNIDDDLALDRDIFVQRARDAACTHFAFVIDGKWEERGEMGWFATVSDEVSPTQWNTRFNAMLDALPDDTLLTVVDCHI